MVSLPSGRRRIGIVQAYIELTLISISVIHNEGVIMPSLKYLPLLHIETELHSPKSFTQNFKCAIQVVCVWQGYFSKEKYFGIHAKCNI